MVVMVEVVQRCSKVVFLSVSQGLFRSSSVFRHIPLSFFPRVFVSGFHWVFVVTVEASMVHGAVIEVFIFIVSIAVTMVTFVGRFMPFSFPMLNNVFVMMSIIQSFNVMTFGDDLVDNFVMTIRAFVDNFVVGNWDLVDNFVMNNRHGVMGIGIILVISNLSIVVVAVASMMFAVVIRAIVV